MKTRLTLLLRILGVIPLCPINAAAQPPQQLALTNATLIDVRSGERRPATTVVVEGNRIVLVAPSASVILPAGATVIDAAGKYLMPGLIDTHVHLNLAWIRPARTDTLALLRWILTGGVTTIRDAASPRFEASYAAARTANEQGRMLAPRIVIAQGVWAAQRYGTSTNEATIERLRQAGVDQIKLMARSRDAALDVIEAAKRAGIKVFGHTDAYRPDSTRDLFAMAAVRAGISGVSHITQISSVDADSVPWIDATPGASVAGELVFLRHWLEATESQVQALIDSMVVRRVWLEPTLSILENHNALHGVCTRGYNAEPVQRYLPWWESSHALPMSAAQRDSLLTACGRMRGFVKRFWEAGGMVIAGSDFVPFPPFGVTYEIELLTRAGLSPLAALQAATLHAAAALEIEHEVGTVEAGKLADLLLLEANPLEDVAHLRRIFAVVANGRLLDRATLQMLGDPAAGRDRAAEPRR
jgi:imidazolonepropionase-like amidohydrolase